MRSIQFFSVNHTTPKHRDFFASHPREKDLGLFRGSSLAPGRYSCCTLVKLGCDFINIFFDQGRIFHTQRHRAESKKSKLLINSCYNIGPTINTIENFRRLTSIFVLIEKYKIYRVFSLLTSLFNNLQLKTEPNRM